MNTQQKIDKVQQLIFDGFSLREGLRKTAERIVEFMEGGKHENNTEG